MIRLLTGDALDVLATLPADSVQCCVTSPPYYGLRDYGVDGQIGLEQTPDAYVERLVAVFWEVRRVLRPDGVLWLNVGDSYAASAPGNGQTIRPTSRPRSCFGHQGIPSGYKPKDLIGIPWLLAFALRADGWWLRSEVIWSKPNPMPESVTDRPTKAHEQVFLLTKAARYFYDAEAVREKAIHSGEVISLGEKSLSRGQAAGIGKKPSGNGLAETITVAAGRNLRSVWTLATHPCSEAHFATMPPALAERCIKAGTSERGCCPVCGAPWERVVDRSGGPPPGDHRKRDDFHHTAHGDGAHPTGTVAGASLSSVYAKYGYAKIETTGWQPTCSCPPADPVPCGVLDPFSGAGTTAMVAARLGRDAIGIELNPAYVELSRRRIEADQPLLNRVEVVDAAARRVRGTVVEVR